MILGESTQPQIKKDDETVKKKVWESICKSFKCKIVIFSPDDINEYGKDAKCILNDPFYIFQTDKEVSILYPRKYAKELIESILV